VRKKDCVAARKFNDLRLGPLRHESLEVRVDHSVLSGNYCVARLLFPSRNCGLRLKCITWNRYLGYRHKTRDWLRSVCSEIIRKRIGVDCQKNPRYGSAGWRWPLRGANARPKSANFRAQCGRHHWGTTRSGDARQAGTWCPMSSAGWAGGVAYQRDGIPSNLDTEAISLTHACCERTNPWRRGTNSLRWRSAPTRTA